MFMYVSKNRKMVALILILIAVPMLLLSGCSKASNSANTGTSPEKQKEQLTTRGVSDTEVLIGGILPLTGPAAAYALEGIGMEAYLKLVNDNGGVNGRKLRLIMEDDQYQPAQTVAKARKLVEQDRVFAIVGPLGTAPNLAIKDYLIQNQIPVVGPGTGATALVDPPNKYYFCIATSYAGEITQQIIYAAEKLEAKKIALAYQNDDVGKEAAPGIKKGFEKVNLKPVEEQAFAPSNVDFSSQALKLKNSGAEVVIITTTVKNAAALINQMAKFSYKPTIILNNASVDQTLFDLAGQNLDGVLATRTKIGVTSNDPSVVQFKEALKKYYPNETPKDLTYLGWANTVLFVEGLKRAGKNLTTDSYITAMETIKDWSWGTTAPLTFTSTQRLGQDTVYFVKADYKTKSFNTISDYINVKK